MASPSKTTGAKRTRSKATQAKTTQDHEEIRKWAEERGGKPSHVKSTGSGDDVGILRIDFPGYSGAGSLEEISWEDWFEKFDKQGLALLYEEETAAGEKSNFNKLVSEATARENEQRSSKKASGKKASTKSAASKKTAGKKAITKKAASKKTASKKAGKKASSRKPTSKKAATKKAVKKGATKKAGKKTASKKRR